MQDSFTFAILGAGGRGQGFAQWIAEHPQVGRVVAVADPDPDRRKIVADMHRIPESMQFETWEELLDRPQLADAALNTLMDRLHAPAAVKALAAGYHMLLEKPMAVTYEDCVAIDETARRYNRIVCVCHSMQYHQTYAEAKRLVRSGAIGDLVTFDHLEPVNPYHQAHSFVRGNWGNEGRSSNMLLAKSCHDIDLIADIVDRKCERVSSFGSLTYFRPEYAPQGATMRCMDGCPAEEACSYSALKFYLQPNPKWPSCAGYLAGLPIAEKIDALKVGPFGRCVYHCDNDVVDHQVVNFEFDGGVTGTFTMTAFRDHGVGRMMRLHGTDGYLQVAINTNTIDWLRYSDERQATITLPAMDGGHGGADHNLMLAFISALRHGDSANVATGTGKSLASHAIVFAAERARHQKRVVEMSEFTPTTYQPGLVAAR
ncbi:MAG TPA: Gfo/Idh/MocA family oxidoreductase [Capsulimonadaceae bacterium]|jgi:predicted dehydrogenase